MQRWLRAAFAASFGLAVLAMAGNALAQADPPARVGRISYLAGTVSYQDSDESRWSPAVANYPFTTGSALWTEPNGRAEMVVAGMRVRLQGATEIDALALDDEQFRLRLPQGRIDVRTSGVASERPVEILTPRGTVRLTADGDYLIEAGTTDDPTRIGVRAGAAQFVDANGSVLAVQAGEIGSVSGMTPVVFSTQRLAPPPMPPEWAARDRQIVYRPAPQYIASTVTGYEDLDAYGSWTGGGDYGQVWVPRAVPAGWAPYRYGHWAWVRPWGWTWVDDAPWGFAPFHYGRWVMFNNRWSWVPPSRTTRPVYAPAVVGFVGATIAEFTFGSRGPAVGWFPLGPREVYVPPYTTNRTYIRNINVTNVYNVTEIERRTDYVERWKDRRDGRRDDERWTYANQRYATVVPTEVFEKARPVNRAALRVQGDRLVKADVAPVAAPPVLPDRAPDKRLPDAKGPDAKAPAPVVGRTTLGDMPTLGRPERQERPAAPGPKSARVPDRPDSALPPAAGPRPGQPDDKRLPPTGAVPPAKGPGMPPRPDEKVSPPGRPDLPPLRERGPGPQATPKEPSTPAVPPAPGVAPKPSERVGPPPTQPPTRERDQVAPPPKPPEKVAPAPTATPKAPERVAPPPRPEAPPPTAAPRPAPEPVAPPPPAAAPRPAPERVAPPPKQEAPRAAPPPPQQARPPHAEPPRSAAPPPPKEPPRAAPPPPPQPAQRDDRPKGKD